MGQSRVPAASWAKHSPKSAWRGGASPCAGVRNRPRSGQRNGPSPSAGPVISAPRPRRPATLDVSAIVAVEIAARSKSLRAGRPALLEQDRPKVAIILAGRQRHEENAGYGRRRLPLSVYLRRRARATGALAAAAAPVRRSLDPGARMQPRRCLRVELRRASHGFGDGDPHRPSFFANYPHARIILRFNSARQRKLAACRSSVVTRHAQRSEMELRPARIPLS